MSSERQLTQSLSTLVMVFFLSVTPPVTRAITEETHAAGTSFSRDIQPILTEKCVRCHGGVRKKAGLTFLLEDTAKSELKSGYRAIVPGDIEASELVRRVHSTDPDEKMPPEEELTEQEKQLLVEWIKDGAVWDTHWSFLPVSDQPIETTSADVFSNPIDQLVSSKLSERNWSMSPEAEPETLIRRVHLDLTGLLPEVDELESLKSSWSEATYQALIDRLLNSPHFGERWGRYWLDQARYADSDGYEKDRPRPNAWRFREWVIHAINEDMPFDQFTRWQLAGDIIFQNSPDAEKNPEMLVASAFHRQTLFNTEGGVDREEDRVKRVVDRVSTTASVWTGLTMGCAQCHDHPYDPITQKEFYQFFAFFNNDAEPEIEVPVRYNNPGASEKMKAAVMQYQPEDKHRETYIFRRGDFMQPVKDSGPVSSGFPAVYRSANPKEEGKLNRLDLANQLLDSSNPLTARVTVNSVWQKLFGRGLMPTLDDWGTRGAKPVHSELLDWLANEFRQSGWSRKAIIKSILLSRAYRQSSHFRSAYESEDPGNAWIFRQNRVRLDAELIRDLFLQAGDVLDLTVGGASVFPPLPPDVAAQSYANNFQWKVSEHGNKYRRGLYTFFKRTAPHPNLILFDCTDSNASVSQRMISNTPLQALATLQNEVFMDAARHFGTRLFQISSHESMDVSRTLSRGFEIALSRKPESEAEVDVLKKLYHDARAYYTYNPDQAKNLVHPNSGNQPVESAPWVIVARTILNLDEFINRN